ncbi:MAG TPA: RNA polymerase sigma-70 factor [Actinomycetota bacterium]|nr:RNA polymerase sigma-70 factor [Actinomycetota bacterium]
MENAYKALRPLLFSLAYRMTGSVGEAEDIVQEAFLRFHRARAGGEEIASTKGYLVTIVTRLSIDHSRSARVQRERYVGTWLPEPILNEEVPDVAASAELAESLSLAFLVLLETLSPVERAAFLLHDVFGYPYVQVAEVIGKTEENARQLAARARRHIEARRPRFEASKEERDALARAFFQAAQEGHVERLISLLADEAVAYADGGGKAPAASQPIQGAERVARFLVALGAVAMRRGVRVRLVEANGQPAILAVEPDGRVGSVMALQIADGRIHAIASVVNPDKLVHLTEGHPG